MISLTHGLEKAADNLFYMHSEFSHPVCHLDVWFCMQDALRHDVACYHNVACILRQGGWFGHKMDQMQLGAS